MKQLIVTCIPSFYKNIAFVRIAKESDVKVFFTFDSKIKRNEDFYRYALEDGKIVKKEGVLKNIKSLYVQSREADFVTLGGWDDLYFWFLRLVVPKHKLKLIVESSIYEFKDSKVLSPLKKFFIKGISECIVSGKPHRELVKHLGFAGKIKISKGVGVLDFDYVPKVKVRPNRIVNFLYIGRLSDDKGIDLLLAFFKKNKNLQMNIVGNIEDEKYLNISSISQNITYHGYKNREELKGMYSVNDVFILASKIEPWGLVVEEALYHGLPVIVSDKVGCNEDLVKEYNVGEVFALDDLNDLSKKIKNITDVDQYMSYCKNVNSINFEEISDNYIKCFL